MRKWIFTLAFTLVTCAAFAQDETGLSATNILFRHEFTGQLSIHSSGFSFGARRAFHPNALKKRAIDFEFSTLRHPKEVKIYHAFEGGRGYYFGKLNNLVTTRVGFGEEPVIARKTDRGSVEIRYLYYGGLSLGILKPVYLEVLYPAEQAGYYIKKIEQYDPTIHNQNNINGRAAFSEGMDELSLTYGAYGKFGFSFEYSKKQETALFLEIGVALDYFPDEVPIMHTAENKHLFTSYYISLHYGMKWNK